MIDSNIAHYLMLPNIQQDNLGLENIRFISSSENIQEQVLDTQRVETQQIVEEASLPQAINSEKEKEYLVIDKLNSKEDLISKLSCKEFYNLTYPKIEPENSKFDFDKIKEEL